MSAPKRKITGASLRHAFTEIIWPRRKLVVVGLVLIFVNRLCGLVLPASTKYIIDDFVQPLLGSGLAFSSDELSSLWVLLGALVAAVVVQAASSYSLTLLLSVEAQRLIADLRSQVQRHVLRLPVRVFDNTKSGELVSRIMDDVEGVRNLVGTGLVQLVGGGLTAIVCLGFLLDISWQMTLWALLPLGGFALVSTKAFQKMRPAFRERGKIRAEVSGRLTEALGGIRVIKGFHAISREEAVFAEGVMRIFANVRTTLTAQSMVMSLGSMFTGLGGVLVLGFGGWLIVQGDLTVGSLFAFSLFLGFLIAPVMQMANIGTQMTEAFAGLDRTTELLGWPLEDDDPKRVVEMPEIVGHVRFENVLFCYETDKPVLRGIDIDAPAGAVVALVGSSGSGKSTTMSLAASFLTPDDGRILVDGVDLRTVKLDSYRSQLGLVLQDDFLFDGSIRDNLLFARPDAEPADVRAAAERSFVTEFSDRFPDGLDTIIGERGVKLSGGQRQRVTIARAILADPRLLLLDEATSSLDTESEALIQLSLKELLKDRTTFVIAHRLSTIQRADQILVVEGGRIVERGMHDELMERRGRYFELYTLQARI